MIKHLLVGGMAAVSMAQTWGVLPEIRRALLKAQKTGDSKELAALHRREAWLVRLNMFLALLVLLATAFARAA